jgi:hypothetical protein
MGFGSWIRDLGSGKNLLRIPDPAVKNAPDPGYSTLRFCKIKGMKNERSASASNWKSNQDLHQNLADLKSKTKVNSVQSSGEQYRYLTVCRL